jgi:hypothetical protein
VRRDSAAKKSSGGVSGRKTRTPAQARTCYVVLRGVLRGALRGALRDVLCGVMWCYVVLCGVMWKCECAEV